jgi:transketolase
VVRANGYDLSGLYSAIGAAKTEVTKPSLIIVDTVIGYGSPNKAGSHEVHGAPLGPDEVKSTKQALGLDPEASFAVSEADYAFIEECRRDWQAEYDDWKKDFTAWSKAYPELRAQWDICYGTTASSDEQAVAAGTARMALPEIEWPAYEPGAKVATRVASGAALQKAAAALPNLIGGSADLGPSNNSTLKAFESYQKGNRLGRNLHYGVREHAMGNILNGLVLHGGVKSFAATFMVFSDYLRPTLRLAALMKIPSIFLFTHDSFWVGEDGPTHQPTEHLATMRAIAGLELLRPCDAEETNLCWQLALEKRTGAHHPATAGKPHPASVDPEAGPVAFAFSRQNLPVLGKPAGWQDSVRRFGAWVAFDTPTGQKPSILILASGSEVSLAFGAAQKLQSAGTSVRVVAVPSLQRLIAAMDRGDTRDGQPAAHLLPTGAHRYAVEAGNFMSWGGLVGREDFLGVNGFGECGPGEKVAAHFGLTVDGVVALVKNSLSPVSPV